MKEEKEVMPHNVPSYASILLSKQFHQDFFEKLRKNILYELTIFSLILVYGITTKNYFGPIVFITIYFLVLTISRAYKFREKVEILILEESLKLLKSKKE